MEQLDKLKEEIRDLAKIQLHTDSNVEPKENRVLIEEHSRIRAKVLAKFGLPNSDDFGKILFVKSLPTEKEVNTIINNLKKAATEYWLSPAKTEAQILEESIQNKLNPEQVFAELGITKHLYTIFVYNEILLNKLDHPLSVLKAMRLANDPKTLNLLGVVALTKNLVVKKEMLEYLSNKGIKYLDNYISAFQLDGKEKDIKQSLLAEFWRVINGGFEFKTLEEKFSTLAHYLMNNLCLVVADQSYRIIELEIYYHDSKKHPDPYVHCDKKQLVAGKWYFNGAGLDITFGDYEKKIYGGILIRGIRKLGENPYYISGPSNVLKEIFSNIGDIFSCKGSIYLRELNQDIIQAIETEPIQAVRIGLKKKEEDVENYAEKKYRYLVELNLQHKFKDKEKVVRQLLADNKITKEKAKEIMGYNINP
jgi:hypothetical protein